MGGVDLVSQEKSVTTCKYKTNICRVKRNVRTHGKSFTSPFTEVHRVRSALVAPETRVTLEIKEMLSGEEKILIKKIKVRITC